MTKMRLKITIGKFSLFFLLQAVLMFSSRHCMLIRLVQAQHSSENDHSAINSSQLNDSVVVKRLTELAYQRLANVTTDLIHHQIGQHAKFCIRNPEADWNNSFNFSSNLDFLSKCIISTRGDLLQRICTAAELKFYFSNFISSKSLQTTFLQPNRNCNHTAWIAGCEPGWACKTDTIQHVDFRESSEIPARTSQCQPCCEGFFCPHRLTCMIPCPLGSHCPLATFNHSTDLCDPYLYQLPAGKTNHTCGGANIWADVQRSGSMFCSAGSYCPTSTQEIPCSDGHYCRMGSTTETRCFRLTSCGSTSTQQNITQYGLMLIVGISFLLFVCYICYGHVMTTRERRYARSRESAAKSVKENAQANGRSANNAVIGQANERTSQVSSSCIDSILAIEHQYDATSGVKEVESGFQDMGEHGSKFEDVNPVIDKKVSDAKLARSDTQIFKYAYFQIEMEKAQQQNKDVSFSEVILKMVHNEIKRRPPIEISFKDLTVTLKQNQYLLRSVTGEVLPGRITAVMGPSGAGKTTLLSALAGRVVGCGISGTVLINGKVESIRSYKKIVGFVPQDDVVHGNLTVEENIWFSADCRLSADLPKAEKVLIVERVIESLGLHPVRASLVGTVENRGISGGQRKRVNVGLELVMEPSLLFLDEPTSGLDSSSSQLLLRALRREATEGVNICMVVHQPSYSLFNMFDDLILLAKEGRTAYHGPVSDVEDYFANLGINVPERINPPDYFIDVLEEMVKPSTGSEVSYGDLPLRWRLHKGYTVPQDMQNLRPDTPKPATDSTSQKSGPEPEELSFCREYWHDAICNNFFNPKDLSGRKTPCILLQFRYFLGRLAKQRLREARIQSIDYLILSLAGACLGLMTKSETDDKFGGQGYIDTVIATSLLCKVAALRTFSLEKLQFRRERASGISSLAYFMAKDTIDHFNTLIKPLVYLSTFYFFSNPRSSFLDNYIVLLCLVYCVTGIAYVLSIFLEPGPSQLCSVLLPVVLTLLATQPKDSQFIRIATNLCYPSWALEAFIISDAKRYYGVWLIQRCAALVRTGYNLHHWNLCISLLMAAGAGCRVLAFFGMLVSLRNR